MVPVHCTLQETKEYRDLTVHSFAYGTYHEKIINTGINYSGWYIPVWSSQKIDICGVLTVDSVQKGLCTVRAQSIAKVINENIETS